MMVHRYHFIVRNVSVICCGLLFFLFCFPAGAATGLQSLEGFEDYVGEIMEE